MFKLNRHQLASRLTMNSCPDPVAIEDLQDADITIIEVRLSFIPTAKILLGFRFYFFKCFASRFTSTPYFQVGDLEPIYQKKYVDLMDAYPNAKVAGIETGGHFPFLSRSEEFAAYMRVGPFVIPFYNADFICIC